MNRVIVCLVLLWTAGELTAQSKPLGPYRVYIRMRESSAESKPKDSSYTLLVQPEAKGTLNASYRIPYYSSTRGEAKELHTVALGSIFECAARDAEGGVRLDCAFESSFVSPRRQATLPVGFPPVVQSRQAHTSAVVPFGVEVALAELDDPTTGDRVAFFVSAERFQTLSGEKHNP